MLEIGQEIYKYKITLDFIKNEVSKDIESNKVIGLNQYRLCLDDYSFTRIDLEKKSYNSNCVLENAACNHCKLSNYYDEITGTIYSSKKDEKKQYLKIKKALEKYIQQKFGRYVASDLLDKLEI